MTAQNHNEIVSEAIKDPDHVYKTPQDVVVDSKLSDDEKLKVLESWELDQNRLLESEAENMGEPVENEKAAKRLQEISDLKAELQA